MNWNYKKKAIEASIFVVFGFGMSQFIRLLGNIILTRLLVPELFGIVAIASVFWTGLHLFSDIGLAPGIIRSDRSEDPDFLNSAWTLQVIRGFILAALALLIASPVASIYKEPILLKVIPVIGLNSILRSFESTSLITLNKDLEQKKLILIELVVQIINVVCMIIIAYRFRSIWALVVGGILGTLFRTIWSHIINAASPNKFFFERSSVKELLSFGKWIIISTAMTFLASQTDRLILGKLFIMELFGVYNIAVTFAELPRKVIERLSANVVFPLITKFSNQPRAELRSMLKVPRGKLLFPIAILFSLFGCFGDFIIIILYDQRYIAASWILPLLAFGMWPLVLISTVDKGLFSIGKPIYSAIGNFLKFSYMIVAIPLFYKIGGQFGAVLAVVLNDIPIYIVVNYGLKREKLSFLIQDLWATLSLLAVSGLLLLVRVMLGLGLPVVSFFSK